LPRSAKVSRFKFLLCLIGITGELPSIIDQIRQMVFMTSFS
jgi:hypothetical protein